jgi:hypothetical protein
VSRSIESEGPDATSHVTLGRQIELDRVEPLGGLVLDVLAVRAADGQPRDEEKPSTVWQA